MALVFLTLVAVGLSLLYAYLRFTFNYWERRGVPHEPPILILGNVKGLGKTRHFRDINQRIYDQFKSRTKLAGIYFFISPSVLVFDLEVIKHILIKDFSNFHDRGVFYNVRDDPLTGHLLALEGAQWKAMRNKLTPVFTSGKMKFMFPIVVEVGENLSLTCGKLIDADDVIEVKELCARFTTDVIGTCAFGIQCNSLEDPNAEFRSKGRSVFGKPRHAQIIQAFMLTNPSLARKLRMKLFSDEVSEFFIAAVKRTVSYRIANNVKRNDFMDMLIEMMAKDQEMTEKSDGIDLSQGLTVLQMAAQAFVFFVAGFDTSSTTMSFCLYELAMNQDIQNKLRKEILEVLSKHNGVLTYEAMAEMQYLDKVLAETLRKYPVLPHLLRKATADYPVPDSSVTIEKNVTVLIPIYAIHHDPEYYPKPEKFDPSRFDEEIVNKRHPCAYLPFGDGPRNCIGLRFGKMQAKIGLISLLKSYKFSKAPLTEVPVVLSKKNFIISAENGIHLKVERAA